MRITGAALVLAATLVTGCSESATKEVAQNPPPSATTVSAPPVTQEPVVETPTPTPEDNSPARVGADQFTYTDGLVVQVPKIARKQFSDTAAGINSGDIGFVVTVRLTNGTPENFDAALCAVNVSVGPEGIQGESVYDSDSNIGPGFTGSIAPGRNGTAQYGFAVPKGTPTDTLVVEVSPSFTHDASLFEGSL